MKTAPPAALFALILSLAPTATWAEDPYAVEWIRQIGTAANDYSYSVAVDGSGNAYVSGVTSGSLEGVNAGDQDAFLTKFDSDGLELWTKQIGAESADISYAVTVDRQDNVYISGSTTGSLGGANEGFEDAFLTKLDSGGIELWTQQIGTDRFDESYSVAIDGSGNAFISGYTQ